jgi:hypothetical protein
VLASTGSLGRAAAAAPGGLTHRGVTYDTGTLTLGALSRPRWSSTLMEGDIAAIAGRLHCSSVAVFGSEVERLGDTATAALERGMHVAIQPRLYDLPRSQILDQLARTAQMAETLRLAHPDKVRLIAGCEHTLFTPGIVPGRTFLDRIARLGEGGLDWAAIQRRLNMFLREAAGVARAHFHGPLTYAAAEFEAVDWAPFDIVGVDYYAFHTTRAAHQRALRRYRRWGKPVVISEFGSCTYRGAPRRGGSGYDIVDWSKPIPEIVGHPVRSERTQADHIARMLDVFEAEALDAAYVYTFIAPDAPHTRDPKHDLDIASFAVVKVIRERLADPASRYRWQPKRAFHTIADHYARAGSSRENVPWQLARRSSAAGTSSSRSSA